jgi:hypothetical protein
MPRGKLQGFELWQALSLAFWNVKKEGEYWENADCIEIIDRPDTLVDADAFRAVLAAVWAKDSDDE